MILVTPLHWRHNGPNGVSNRQPYDCLFNRLFRHRSKKTSKLRVAGLCEGNSPVTGEFPAQRVSNAENVSIWWRHRALQWYLLITQLYSHDIIYKKKMANADHRWDLIDEFIMIPLRRRNINWLKWAFWNEENIFYHISLVYCPWNTLINYRHIGN